MYAMPADFNPDTNQLYAAAPNERLVALFARAVTLVAQASPDADFPALWKRERARYEVAVVKAQQESERKQYMAMSQSDQYVWLIRKRDQLERETAKQLAELDAEIEMHRVALKLPKRPVGDQQRVSVPGATTGLAG